MPLTDDQRADLTLLREADSEYQEAKEKRDDHIRSAIRGGAPFESIGLALGMTGAGVRMLATRRGWYTPREYRRG